MIISAVLLAAGSSSRMGESKLTLDIGGRTPLCRSFLALREAGIRDIAITVCPLTRAEANKLSVFDNTILVEGGSCRGESVLAGLRALKGSDIVVIHDAARCLVSADIIKRSIDSAERLGSGIAATKVYDTIFDTAASSAVNREKLLCIQTPQTFSYKDILAAYEGASDTLFSYTDDSAVYAMHGLTPHFVEGSSINRKLTAPSDLEFFRNALGVGGAHAVRTGFGFDTHGFTQGDSIMLCGEKIPYRAKLLGHSDADVAVHALMDALLGAAAMRDIGFYFPDTSADYKGADSMKLLKRVLDMLVQSGFEVVNVDITIVAQAPKLSPYIENMRLNISKNLLLPADSVAVKATTTEGMNDEGRGNCISAYAVCSIRDMRKLFGSGD